jgi:S-formylglutathione hydrolase FrmB
LNRRRFLEVLAGAVVVGGLGAAGLLEDDVTLRYKLAEHLGLHPGPDLVLPSSGARIVEGSFESRSMHGQVSYAYSLPANRGPEAIVISLYGMGGNQLRPFTALHLPDAAAHVGAPLCIASAYGGRDNYWHRRANGTDSHAMVVDELVPLLRKRLGPLPLALHGWSMGGYGALLAAERGEQGSGGNLFRGVAASSPALWTTAGGAAPGAFDNAQDFYANDVFTAVDALKSLQVRLDCGDEDPFYQATRKLSSLMTWPHEAVFRQWAAHTDGFWRTVAPAQMRFLARACGLRGVEEAVEPGRR